MTCVWRAASAVTGLKVDPAGYRPSIARFKDGKFASSAVLGARPAFSRRLVLTCPVYSFGSKVGYEAMARIAPFRGFSATIEPPFAAHCPVLFAVVIP